MPADAAAALDVAAEVQSALQSGRAVVALESTIISHGMPYPRNVETALSVEAAVRENGAVPATIAVLDGRLKVGLSKAEIERLGRQGTNVINSDNRSAHGGVYSLWALALGMISSSRLFNVASSVGISRGMVPHWSGGQ